VFYSLTFIFCLFVSLFRFASKLKIFISSIFLYFSLSKISFYLIAPPLTLYSSIPLTYFLFPLSCMSFRSSDVISTGTDIIPGHFPWPGTKAQVLLPGTRKQIGVLTFVVSLRTFRMHKDVRLHGLFFKKIRTLYVSAFRNILVKNPGHIDLHDRTIYLRSTFL
jgi:hypothetical protein